MPVPDARTLPLPPALLETGAKRPVKHPNLLHPLVCILSISGLGRQNAVVLAEFSFHLFPRANVNDMMARVVEVHTPRCVL